MQAMNPNLWSSIPFILLPLAFLALAFSISVRDKRLVREGEISIGKVIDVRRGRRGRTVTYEFPDRSGRLVTASSPDNTRKISAGMAIPIFSKTENPQRDQNALCGSFYEVADSSDEVSAAKSR